MRKRIISALLCIAMTGTVCASLSVTALADGANTPQYQTTAREMEKLNRGLIAVKVSNGVYLSWRVFGTEDLATTAYEVYREGTAAPIATIAGGKASNYTDANGTTSSKYKVVKVGATEAEKAAEEWVEVNPNNFSTTNNSPKNSYSYVDIPIQIPADVERMGDGKLSSYRRSGKQGEWVGGANDASVGDLDGDGDYEIVLKWDPQDSKDSAGADFTGNVYIDAYEIDPNAESYKWRIDLGKNVTAGAHYTQFIVYDFDGDGKAEIAMKTAPGSKDGTGEYVSKVGDSDEIRNVDNEKSYIETSGRLKGKNPFTQYLTIFDGETGEALYTTDYIPYEMHADSNWGDDGAKYNRSERYLAGVAYLDGVHPSLIMCRGYYDDAVIRAYDWDGSTLSMRWQHDSKKGDSSTMYGQGNHNLSIADVDNDGKDEIVYGSATLDDDGKKTIDNIGMGHGDALHVSDFDNDGWQEVFSVKEDTSAKMTTGANFRRPGGENKNAALFNLSVEQYYDEDEKKWKWPDVGRGVMANVDDAYAAAHPEALSVGWTSYHPSMYGLDGTEFLHKPTNAGKGSFINFLVYWDGDLASELLDADIIKKYNIADGTEPRFYQTDSQAYTLAPGNVNNHSKNNYSLVADIWGDWREEIIMPINDAVGNTDQAALRIMTSTLPTDYRLTTLMHDSQYRCAIAWQNVAYNQPPHTSYYIGSAALATDESGNKLNYLAPATPFTKVKYATTEITTPVTGISLSKDSVRLEKGESELIQAIIEPENADKKTVTWSTTDADVATVANGTITAVGKGTATITATAKDTTAGTFSAQCQVEVYATDVTGIQMPGYDNITIMQGGTAKINASVVPSNATVKTINWSSTNPNVAAVDADGVVTGVGPGSAIIRAVTAEGGFMGEKIVSVAGKVTDKTGDNEFTSTTAGTGTTISGLSATGVSVEQKEATDTFSVQKDFEEISDNKATLSFSVNTGGKKLDGSKYDWTNHEYSIGFSLLDNEGNNILTVSQAQTTAAQDTMYAALDAESKKIAGDWTEVSSGKNSPLKRSAARWHTTVEFDYGSNQCTVSIKNDLGDDGSLSEYRKTFNFDGKVFKTLKLYTTKDGTGTITVSPSISNVSYSYAIPSDGVGSKLYDKATIDANKWTDADISDWTLEGETVAAPAVDAANNRIWYNPPNPGGSYSATKTFDIAEDALVTYDLDWYFGSQVGTGKEHSEYIQIGDKIRFGWKSDYKAYLSKDGGETWETDPVFSGSNSTFTKNIHLVYDKATSIVKSLLFDGKSVMSDTLLEDDPMNKVTFGLNKIADVTTETWNYPNGLDNLTVLQFVEGEEQVQDVEPYVAVASAGGKTVTAEFAAASDADKIIGALYDGTALKEVKWADISSLGDFAANKVCTGDLTFDNDVSGCKVKLFMWNGLGENELKPAVPAAQYE